MSKRLLDEEFAKILDEWISDSEAKVREWEPTQDEGQDVSHVTPKCAPCLLERDLEASHHVDREVVLVRAGVPLLAVMGERGANTLTDCGVPTKTGKSQRGTHQAVERIPSSDRQTVSKAAVGLLNRPCHHSGTGGA